MDLRTEDDGSLMVLRTGPSASLDLAAPIACECRPATTGRPLMSRPDLDGYRNTFDAL